MKKPANRIGIVLAAILILSAAPAIAQPQPSQQPQQTQQGAKQEFQRQDLEKYVMVTVEMAKIEQELAQKKQGIKNQESAMKIEQEAARKKISAVEDQGLDLQTYNNIAHQLSVNPDLRKEIEQIIEAKTN
jgi:hypothetical protein